MARAQGGRTAVTARLTGVNDDAGNVVTLTQGEGQTVQDFGKKAARALEPAVKTLPDAKACVDQRTSKPDKAAEAANKAIKALPNHGLAEFCLAQIAMDKKAPRAEVVKHLQASVKGDPLSLPAWTALATQYQQANDTANTLMAFSQMLRVAPTNQKLREELFKYFLQSGHPETAKEVADEGLKLDPNNADLHDLKSNACLFLSDFKCAVDALETMYATDSTKADTLFFTKISAAASEGEKPDTVRLLKWAQTGVKKYPDNLTLLGYLNRAYSLSGPVDSVVSVTNRIIAKDTTAVVPALEAAKALITALGGSGNAPHRYCCGGAGRQRTACQRTGEGGRAVPRVRHQARRCSGQGERRRAVVHRRCSAAPGAPGSRRRCGAAADGRSSQRTPQGRSTQPRTTCWDWPRCFRCRKSIRRPRSRSRATWPRQEQALLARFRLGADRGPFGQPGGGGEKPRYHQEVQAADRVDAEGIL